MLHKYIGILLCAMAVALFTTAVHSQQAPAARGGALQKPLSLQAMKKEPRLALVIGNAAYKTSPLQNPVRDAELMAKTLKAKGFTVIKVLDANKREMEKAINDFGKRIKQGGVGLFYYAGHGLQVHGVNYLVPLGAQIAEEDDVDIHAVDAHKVLKRLDRAANRLNIVILDACRNNPFERSFRATRNGNGQGLTKMDAPQGTLIAYATAPGSVASDGKGNNGTYTEALVAEINRPQEVGLMFRAVRTRVKAATNNLQEPWEEVSLEGQFYFTLPAHPKNLGEVTCPQGTVLRGQLCVKTEIKTEVQCPPNTQWDGTNCVWNQPALAPQTTRSKAEQLYQRALEQEADKQWGAMLASHKKFRKLYGANPNHTTRVMEGLHRSAVYYIYQGKNPTKAQTYLQKTLQEHTKRKLPNTGPNAHWRAQAEYYLQEIQFLAWNKIKIKGNTKQQKKILTKLLIQQKTIQKELESIAQRNVPEWNIASGYAQGRLMSSLAQKLFRSEVPFPKGSESYDIYQEQIERIALPIESEAIKILETTRSKARQENISNPWTLAVQKLLHQLEPQKYTRP